MTEEKKEREFYQRKIEHLNLVIRAIRSVNQLIVREKNRDRLIRRVCEGLIENRGYYNSWIALMDDSSKVVGYSEAGLGKAFLPMIDLLENDELTDCATKALEGSGVILIENPISVCRDCPLSDKYGERGGMTIRLEHDTNIYGIMCVSMPKDLIMDEEEQELLEEVAGDVAFALHDLKLESDRKRAEKALLSSEKNFRNLVEYSLIGISIIQDEKVVYRNPELKSLLGPMPLLFGPEGLKHVHSDDAEKVALFYQRLISRESRTLNVNFRFYPPGKIGSGADMKWVNCRANLIQYQDKDSILINIVDTTKTKELEHVLGTQEKMASLGRVAAGIAHEIRNPLSGINIYLNTLEKICRKDEGLEQTLEIFPQIKSASRKIESVIKRVMDFSRPCEPKFLSMDTNLPVNEAVDLSSVTLRKSGIRINKVLDQSLPQCRLDPQLITQTI